MSGWLAEHRGKVVAVWMLLMLFGVGVLAARAIGEPQRTQAAIDRNAAVISVLLAEQQKEIQADCPFKRRMALLPRLTPRRTEEIIELATTARDAYIHKGCAAAGFGSVPPRFTPNA
jgi:hypothetical protein